MPRPKRSFQRIGATIRRFRAPICLAEIGKRVSNTKNYAAAFKKAGKRTSIVPKFGEFESKSFAKPQPLRTDLERMLGSEGFIDVEIE